MRYEAALTDLCYRYDGSFPGFLCCVFESYRRREIPGAITPPDQGQLGLFGSRDIMTEPSAARRVADGLRRLGGAVQEIVADGFLADSPGKELVLLRFVRLGFEKGPSAARMLGDADVAAAFSMARAVRNEAGKYLEFLRFEQRGEMLGAVIHPHHAILPLLRDHFCSRLPEETFVILDATHRVALLHKDGCVQYRRMERFMPPAGEEEAEEKAWRALWKQFFTALTIEERRNERCQRTHAPKRYWQDMCEMAP